MSCHGITYTLASLQGRLQRWVLAQIWYIGQQSLGPGAGTYKQIGMKLWWCGWDVLVQRTAFSGRHPANGIQPLQAPLKRIFLVRGGWYLLNGYSFSMSCFLHDMPLAQAQVSTCAHFPRGYMRPCSRAQNHLSLSLHSLVFSSANMLSFTPRWARCDMCMAIDVCHQWSTSAVMEHHLPDVIWHRPPAEQWKDLKLKSTYQDIRFMLIYTRLPMNIQSEKRLLFKWHKLQKVQVSLGFTTSLRGFSLHAKQDKV